MSFGVMREEASRDQPVPGFHNGSVDPGTCCRGYISCIWRKLLAKLYPLTLPSFPACFLRIGKSTPASSSGSRISRSSGSGICCFSSKRSARLRNETSCSMRRLRRATFSSSGRDRAVRPPAQTSSRMSEPAPCHDIAGRAGTDASLAGVPQANVCDASRIAYRIRRGGRGLRSRAILV
jgi:hypothetical protein